MNPAAPIVALGLLAQFVTEHGAAKERAKRRYQTGSLLCPGIDVGAFEEECRAPIFRDSWNRWRVYYTSAHGVEPAKVKDVVYGYMGKLNASLDGKIRHVKVDVGKSPWASPILVNRMMACGYGMTLKSSEYAPAFWDVYVEFVYRGAMTHIPWPSLDGWPTPHTCPTAADFLLESVHAPSQVDVPDAKTDSPLPPHVDPENEGWGALTPDIDPTFKIAIGGLGIVALAVAAGYAVRSFK